MQKSIYLDYASGTPVDPAVKQAMEPFFTDEFYNPSAIYLAAKNVKRSLNDARAVVAKCLGARPAEIIFTAGATEANNLAVQGVMRQYPDTEVLVSAVEHDSVLAPAKLFNTQEIPVTKQGIVDLDKLVKVISPKTVLISVMHTNNELGSIQPLADITQLINQVRKQRRAAGNDLPLLLHSDAAQAGNFFDLHVARLGVDMLSLNGGKIYGPKQSGALYVKAGVKLQPLILGGGQEFGLRSGTENMAGSVGLAKALEIAQAKKTSQAKATAELQKFFIDQIEANFPEAIINTPKKHRAPHIVHLTFPGKDNERLLMELDERGIICAVGSACSASSAEPSHVLSAIGLSDELARASLRFSFGRQTTQNDIKIVVETLQDLTQSNSSTF
jgi:cysteine desulfurase